MGARRPTAGVDDVANHGGIVLSRSSAAIALCLVLAVAIANALAFQAHAARVEALEAQIEANRQRHEVWQVYVIHLREQLIRLGATPHPPPTER